MKVHKNRILISIGFLFAFALWTVLVCCLDVRPIGPNGSSVGLAGFNGYFYSLTETNMFLYTLTDWLGLVPIGVAMGFGLLGLKQWIQRKQFCKVDKSILVLGGFYILVMGAYMLFEIVTINYRPVLLNGVLESSYPSSTTMLVLCVMPTTIYQLIDRVQNKPLRICIFVIIWLFILFMVAGRIISGVHWITDIIGGVLLSASLVHLYNAFTS